MTAHKQKPTITVERVEWFANYLRKNLAWGVFHVSLDDNNYELGAASGATWDEGKRAWGPPYRMGKEWTDEVREAAEWFDTLTYSQRRRLGQKAQDIVNTVVRQPPSKPMVVTHIDKARGTVTLESKQ